MPPTRRQCDALDHGTTRAALRLAKRLDGGEAQDVRHLAPQGFPSVLAVEVRSWPASDTGRTPAADSQDGVGEPHLG
jgi:hypothetical protein